LPPLTSESVDDELGPQRHLAFAQESLRVARRHVQREEQAEPDGILRGIEEARLGVEADVTDVLAGEREIVVVVRVRRVGELGRARPEHDVHRQRHAELDPFIEADGELQLRRQVVLDVELVALAGQVEHVVRERADEAEREVEVAEDLRRVYGDIALRIDRGPKILQRERGLRRVLSARRRAVREDQPQDHEDCAARRT
jgi:hypothetical protein